MAKKRSSEIFGEREFVLGGFAHWKILKRCPCRLVAANNTVSFASYTRDVARKKWERLRYGGFEFELKFEFGSIFLHFYPFMTTVCLRTSLNSIKSIHIINITRSPT